MTENRAKGMLGIWSLTPGQVEVANTAPLPPERGPYLLDVEGRDVALTPDGDGAQVYECDDLRVEELDDDRYRLHVGSDERELDADELREEFHDRLDYVPSMDDIVDSMEEFEAAKEAGRGAISMERTVTVVVDGIEIEVSRDRTWDEATYQAAQTPIRLFQEVHEHRPDRRGELEEMYGESVVERALNVG
jgi:bifunctional (S)-malyl-CoA lyase/thioesterase